MFLRHKFIFLSIIYIIEYNYMYICLKFWWLNYFIQVKIILKYDTIIHYLNRVNLRLHLSRLSQTPDCSFPLSFSRKVKADKWRKKNTLHWAPWLQHHVSPKPTYLVTWVMTQCIQKNPTLQRLQILSFIFTSFWHKSHTLPCCHSDLLTISDSWLDSIITIISKLHN